MNQGEFTSIYCARPENFVWFLGAGTSRAAGLMTASDIIWDLKKRYYCREENQEIDRQDVQSQAVRERIQSFMTSRAFPEEGADGEYTAYFEKIFGMDKERQRRYLKAALSEDKVTLSVGNRVLAALMSERHARAVFTTNFDTVVERAFAEVAGASLAAYHLEGSASAVQAINNEEFPLYVKLHGDFRHDNLKNLPADLATQNDGLARCLAIAGGRFGFVVCGYSGRDGSVMSALHSVLAGPNPFPHGLFWTGMKGAPALESVSKLLADAKARGVTAEYIEIETFDTLLLRLWRNVEGVSPELDAMVRKARRTAVDIPVPPVGAHTPLIRTNALPLISIPTRCVALSFRVPKASDEIREMRDKARAPVILARSQDSWCWGDEAVIKKTFGVDLEAIVPVQLPENLSSPEGLHLKGFIEEAIISALALGKPLIHRSIRQGSFLIANPAAPSRGILAPLRKVVARTGGDVAGVKTSPIDGSAPEQVRWAEALRVSLEAKNGFHWLLIEPDIWIWPRFARRDVRDFIDQRRKDRFNAKHDALLGAWIQIVLGTTQPNATVSVKAFTGGSDAANPCFTIGSRTAYTRGLAS
ncbi:MAG TPA: SIR2 family protein [Gammaproteobacteria bacterium]|nr:SIR2 family protein [Gammaproteobacteria bacterium]